MGNQGPDDQESSYFVLFHPICHYNVHLSDLEVFDVRFDLINKFIPQAISVETTPTFKLSLLETFFE